MVPIVTGLLSEYFSRVLAMETNNFTFEVKVILGLESTRPDGLRAKIRVNGPHYK